MRSPALIASSFAALLPSSSIARAGLRKRALLIGSALGVSLLASTGALAQCRDNFNTAATIGGVLQPVQRLVPLGTGPSLSALTSTINTVNAAFLTGTSAFVSAPGGAQPDQQGGGVWGRAIAGSVDTNTTSVGTVAQNSINFALANPGFINTGTQNCSTSAHQDYWGYQVGQDISILNAGGTGANWHFGLTAGSVTTWTRDTTPGGTYTNFNIPGFPAGVTFTTPAGSFSEETQVPFVGLYAAYTKGNLFLDGQVRWDFYQGVVSDANNGLSSQRLDARGTSVTANIGYNVPLHKNWFIEPSAGVVWSHVQVDPLSVSGQQDLGGTFAGGTVTVSDIDSVLGHLSLRVGTTIQTPTVVWQPYFTASVFHEFAGDVTSSSLAAVNVLAGGGLNNGVNRLRLWLRNPREEWVPMPSLRSERQRCSAILDG